MHTVSKQTESEQIRIDSISISAVVFDFRAYRKDYVLFMLYVILIKNVHLSNGCTKINKTDIFFITS